MHGLDPVFRHDPFVRFIGTPNAVFRKVVPDRQFAGYAVGFGSIVGHPDMSPELHQLSDGEMMNRGNWPNFAEVSRSDI